MANSPLEHDLGAQPRDLGEGFMVRRAVPQAACRSVGPFVFFDQFGPADFSAGRGLDVRPHPHIGLATVTYLFDGEIVHRDSLGCARVIRPGEINWMVAGRGIVHSERTALSTRTGPSSLAGIQSWIALPRSQEQCPASFSHHGESDLPLLQRRGCRIRLLAGSLFGERAAVPAFSPMGYAHVELESGAELEFGDEFEQSAAYVVSGSLGVAQSVFGAGRLLLPRAHERVRVRAIKASRLMLMAGEPLDGPRFLWWNFVASSRELIERAREDWKAGRLGTIPGDAGESIPLPDDQGSPL
jgi:hypothetical protein